MKRTIFLLLAILFPTAVHASGLQPVKQDGISYVSGGVGIEERAEMKEMHRDFNLFMTFARKSGAYLSDVKVSVSGEGRKFETVTEGPFLFASLPAGKYKIRAESDGSSQTRTVTLGRASEVFYWK